MSCETLERTDTIHSHENQGADAPRSHLPIPNVVSFAVCALLLVNYFGTFTDLDWTWQVRTGEEILDTGSLRVADSFSYTINGTLLPDFEWLYEVVLAVVWDWSGIGGLKFLRVVCVGLPLLLLGLRLRREHVPWFANLGCLILAAYVLTPLWNLRAMYCTTVGLLLVSGWLHDHCVGRRPLTWWLPIVMLVWANCHPGVIAGQGLLVGAILWEWFNSFVKWNKPIDRSALWRLTWIAAAGLAATFICPDPIERLRYTFKADLQHPIMRIFVEMMPLYQVANHPAFLPVYPVAAILFVALALRLRQVRGWELAFLAVLTLLANFAVRSLQDWFLCLFAIGVPHLFSRRSPLETASRPMWRFQWQWPALTVAVLLVVSAIPPLGRVMPKQDDAIWPNDAIEFIDRQGLTGNFFATPNDGAYLGWRLRDRGRCYTDTRGFFVPPELLADSIVVPALQEGWRGRLENVLTHYPTDYFLLETTGDRGRLWEILKANGATPMYLDGERVLLSSAEVRAAIRASAKDLASGGR